MLKPAIICLCTIVVALQFVEPNAAGKAVYSIARFVIILTVIIIVVVEEARLHRQL